MSKRILFVFTSAEKSLTGKQIGWYLPEAAHPYYVLGPKYDIDFASIKGPNPPVDPNSVTNYPDDQKFLDDPAVQQKLANAKKLSDVKAEDYDAIFYVGGFGPAIDLAFDTVNAKLASDFWRAGKVVSAVCHGPAALLLATDAEGNSILKGKRVSVFTIKEAALMNGSNEVPFELETRVKELGATAESAPEPFGACFVVDGKLVTGQNPASGKGIGEAVNKLLSE